MPDLHNQIILITGANRGQGRAIAEHLVSLGGTVIVGARNYERAKKVTEEIGENHAYPVQLDVTKEKDWKVVMKEIKDKFGKLDVLVNNAGVLKRKSFQDITAEDYQELINVNQLGVFLGMQSALPLMEEHNKGSIINNVSISAFAPIGQSSAYAATKAMVVAMSKVTQLSWDQKEFE